MSKRNARELAMRLLANREHSSTEMARKLKQKGCAEKEVEEVLAFVIAENYLSNERFTENFINARRNRGLGPLRIQQELQQLHHIDDDLIRKHLDSSDPAWVEQAVRVRCKKFGEASPTDFEDKARQMQFLQYRGFSSEHIKRAMKTDTDILLETY